MMKPKAGTLSKGASLIVNIARQVSSFRRNDKNIIAVYAMAMFPTRIQNGWTTYQAQILSLSLETEAYVSVLRLTYTRRIIASIKKHNERCPYKTYYFQSKRPAYLGQFTREFPENVILLTTLETNRDEGYNKVSKAPMPSKRYDQFLKLDYPRKVVTIEPVLEFDLDILSSWLIVLKPEYVWLGFNSKPLQVQVPEPSEDKVSELMDVLADAKVKVKAKDLRNVLSEANQGGLSR